MRRRRRQLKKMARRGVRWAQLEYRRRFVVRAVRKIVRATFDDGPLWARLRERAKDNPAPRGQSITVPIVWGDDSYV